MEMKELLKRCNRILHISRKPTGDEYSKVARVTALGMVILGLTGFVISVISGFIG